MDRRKAGVLFGYRSRRASSSWLSDLKEQQETIAATLSAVSQGLGAERLRTTIIILAGTAVTLISAAVWLMTNTLAFG